MERLTIHTPDNFGYAEYQLKPGVDEQDAVSRLAAYENTGLEPEEITANYQMLANIAGAIKSVGIDRLVELAEADQDGRCVVLPCKVGDTINAFRFNEEKGLHVISDKVTAVAYNRSGYTVRTKSKFYPIKEKDGYDFAPISGYPYALADYYIGDEGAAEAALKAGEPQ